MFPCRHPGEGFAGDADLADLGPESGAVAEAEDQGTGGFETVMVSLLYADRGEIRHPGGICARRRGVVEGGRRFTNGGGVERAQDFGLACGLGLGLLPKTGAPRRGPKVLKGADPGISKGA
jgi:hypothetical protein